MSYAFYSRNKSHLFLDSLTSINRNNIENRIQMFKMKSVKHLSLGNLANIQF